MTIVDSASSYRRGTRGRAKLGVVALFAAIAVYYAFLLTNGGFDFFADEALGRVFNHMLAQLLHGHFDMDPAVMGREAFLRNGKTYSYFGIFSALLRLPLLLTGGLATVTISRLSCWLALLLCALAQWWSLALVWRGMARLRPGRTVYFACLAALLLSGPQLTMTFTAWIYNEPILWAAGFVMMFNAIVLRGFVRQRALERGDLMALAALTGLAVNARVAEGLGLTISFGLILLLVAHSAVQARADRRSTALAFLLAFVRDRRIVPSVVVLCLGLAVAGTVNYGRWGNPLVFADNLANIQLIEDAARAAAIRNHGDLNLLRVPTGFLYYFFGVDLRVPFPHFFAAYYDGAGWPRSLMVLTSAATLVLFSLGLAEFFGPLRRQKMWPFLAAAFIGSFCIFFLMLCLAFVGYRYRMDLVPFLALGAVLGVPRLYRLAAERKWRHVVAVMVVLTAASVLVSHVDLLQAKLTSFALSEVDQERVARATEPLSKLFAKQVAPAAPYP
jgi:hypothetical protein